MINWFAFDASFAWICVWQSTLLLSLGLAAGWRLSRHAARGHAVLCLAIFAVLSSPILTGFAARAGLGLFERRIPEIAVVSPSMSIDPTNAIRNDRTDDFFATNSRDDNFVPPSVVEIENRPGPATQTKTISPVGEFSSVKENFSEIESSLVAAGVVSDFSTAERKSTLSNLQPVDWRLLLTFLWSGVGGLLALRLALSVLAARRMVSAAEIVRDGPAHSALLVACQRLNLPSPPALAVSSAAHCPMVWCWGRKALLLIPASWRGDRDAQEMIGVFCHELAHCVRRDHWAHLLSDLAACMLWWQPLMWLTRGRLRQLSERACDDWVLASGTSAVQYADTLVSLIPQRSPATVLAAASSKAALFDRVQHILRGGSSDPRLSWRWRAAVGAIATSVVIAASLAQTREVREHSPIKAQIRPEMTATLQDTSSVRSAEPRIAGNLVDETGAAVNGATVWLAIQERSNPPTPLASVTSDKSGAFSFAKEHVDRVFSKERPRAFVIAQDFKLRIAWVQVIRETSSNALTLRLKDTKDYAARIQDNQGNPIAGASIVVDTLASDPVNQPRRDAITLFAPTMDRMKATTDKDGRFTLTNMPAAGSFNAAVTAAGFGEVLLMCDVGSSPTISLVPAGSIRGRVTLGESSAPGEEIKLWCSQIGRGGNVVSQEGDGFRTWTTIPNIKVDSDGTFEVKEVPPAEYSISASFAKENSSLYVDVAGEKLEVESKKATEGIHIRLKRGVAIRGRVVDPDGKGVAGVTLMVGYVDPTDSITDQRLATTDADGAFTGYTKPGGKALIAVKKLPEEFFPNLPGRLPRLDISGDTEWPTISLKRSAKLRGAVVDGAGKPVPGAEVRCDVRADQFLDRVEITRRPIVCDENGRFEVTQLDPDEYCVFRARSADAASDGGLRVLPRNQSDDVRISVVNKNVCRIKGRVATTAGKPIEGASVSLMWNRSWKSTSPDERVSGFGTNVEYFRSGHDGEFQSGPLWPGDRYKAHVEAAGFSSGESEQVAGVAGEVMSLATITLAGKSGVASGKVVDSDGKPISQAKIHTAGVFSSLQTITTADGAFNLSELPDGNSELFAEKDGYQLTAFVVNSGGTSTVTMLRTEQALPQLKEQLPTVAERRKRALRVIQAVWSQREKCGNDNVRRTIGHLSRFNTELAAQWSRESNGAWDAGVRFGRFRAAAKSDPHRAVSQLGEPIDDWNLSFAIDYAEKLADFGRLESARVIAEDLVTHVRAQADPSRASQLASLSSLLTLADRKDLGRQLAMEAVSILEGRDKDTLQAYDRWGVAIGLAAHDLPKAESLVAAIEKPIERDFGQQAMVAILAESDIAAAENLFKRMKFEVFQADQTLVRMACACANYDPARAQRIVASIAHPYWQSQAYGWLAARFASRDKGLARQMVERGLDVLEKGAEQSLGFQSMGGPECVAAFLLLQAKRLEHPQLSLIANRVQAMRIPESMGYGRAETQTRNYQFAALLGLTVPSAARQVVERSDQIVATLPPDQVGLLSNSRGIAWAVVDPNHAADLAIDAIGKYQPSDDQNGFWKIGISGTLEVLTADPEDDSDLLEPLLRNTGIWMPRRY